MLKVIVAPKHYQDGEFITDRWIHLFNKIYQKCNFTFHALQDVSTLPSNVDVMFLVISGQYADYDDLDKTIDRNKEMKLVVYLHDLHFSGKYLEKILDRADKIFATNDDMFTWRWPHHLDKYTFSPLFFAPHERYAKYTLNKNPKMRCLHAGMMWKGCTLRETVQRLALDDESKIDMLLCSDFNNRHSTGHTGAPMGKEFADYLHSYFCSVTSTVYKCVIAKHFEIPATGALLLTNQTADLDKLGFIPFKHYLPVTEATVGKTIKKCLSHPENFEQIRREGMKFVRSHHSIKNRIGEIVECLNKEKQKRIKLYVAVLNKGWIRRELVHTLFEMKNTKGVKITLENLSKTYAHPICSNRNSITKRFLATDNDFLMMIDNDVIPLHNPAELVFADKDVIGSPAKVRQYGRNLNWVAYIKNPNKKNSYAPVDFDAVDDTTDLLSVDIVGTGCILIKRKVLESIKAPFLIKYNKDGICTHGTDFAFCIKAKKAGFEVYTTPQRVCEHIKEAGLLDMKGYDDSDGRDALALKYDIPWGEFVIPQGAWHFIRDIIKEKGIRTVLEFGSGLSSLLMSELVEVHSFETDEKWMDEILSKVNGHKNMLSITLWDGKKMDEAQLRSGYDLAFVDGPKGKAAGGIGRRESMRIAAEYAKKVIVHDAGRQEEHELQQEYLKNKFRLKKKSGWHLQRCHYWERRTEENK